MATSSYQIFAKIMPDAANPDLLLNCELGMNYETGQLVYKDASGTIFTLDINLILKDIYNMNLNTIDIKLSANNSKVGIGVDPTTSTAIDKSTNVVGSLLTKIIFTATEQFQTDEALLIKDGSGNVVQLIQLPVMSNNGSTPDTYNIVTGELKRYNKIESISDIIPTPTVLTNNAIYKISSGHSGAIIASNGVSVTTVSNKDNTANRGQVYLDTDGCVYFISDKTSIPVFPKYIMSTLSSLETVKYPSIIPYIDQNYTFTISKIRKNVSKAMNGSILMIDSGSANITNILSIKNLDNFNEYINTGVISTDKKSVNGLDNGYDTLYECIIQTDETIPSYPTMVYSLMLTLNPFIQFVQQSIHHISQSVNDLMMPKKNNNIISTNNIKILNNNTGLYELYTDPINKTKRTGYFGYNNPGLLSIKNEINISELKLTDRRLLFNDKKINIDIDTAYPSTDLVDKEEFHLIDNISTTNGTENVQLSQYDLGSSKWIKMNPYSIASNIKTSSGLTLQQITDNTVLKTKNISGAAYEYNQIGGYITDYVNPSITGTFKITLPKTWSNTMISINIKGYDYSSIGSYELILSGYNYNDESTWFNTSAYLLGNAPFTSVRFAYDGTHCCILLGTISTIWHYPTILIDKVITRMSNTTGWDTGWSFSFLTSEDGVTGIVNVPINSEMNVDKVDGYDFNQSLMTNDSPSFSKLTLSVASGAPPLTVTSSTLVANLNVDMTDGYHMNQNVLTSSSPSFSRIISTVATGTAPLTVTSSTLVTNLNADMINGAHLNQLVRNDVSTDTVQNISSIGVGHGDEIWTKSSTDTLLINYRGPDETTTYPVNTKICDGKGSPVLIVTGSTKLVELKGKLIVNGQITNYTTSGTAPFYILSNTMVTNLNSDEVDGNHATDLLNRANHTGTQTASTISNFEDTVRSTALTGLTLGTNTAILATDNLVIAASKLQTQISGHLTNTSNPHSVTKAQVGLENVDNTADSSKNVLSATKLTTARTISLSGDITGTISFDGSANVNSAAVLAASGISAGTYKSVTVDIKGRVTEGTNPTTLAGYGITDAISTSTYTASDILTKLKTVDGINSGLDSDYVRGYTPSNGSGNIPISNGTLNTNLNADKVDGYDFNQSLTVSDSPSFSKLTLSVASGTPPLTVTSSTLVANLNVDLLDGHHSSYFQQANTTVLKTGDRMTGLLEVVNISANGNYNENIRLPLVNNWSDITYGTTAGVLSGAGDGVWTTGRDSDKNFDIWHNSERSTADGRVLKLGYDKSFTWGGHTIWHDGNDGSGSGADADLLDGQHLIDITSGINDEKFLTVTDSNSVASLPNSVTGQLNFSLKGRTLKNEIVNGNFDSAAYWSVNGCTVSIINNICTCTITSLTLPGLYKKFTSIIGHKYYFRTKIIPKYGNPSEIGFSRHGNYTAVSSIAGVLNTISTIRTSTAVTDAIIFYQDARTNYAIGDTFTLQKCMCIDLTAMFGAGNEPTQAWCDTNIPWFDGIKSVGESESNKIEVLSRGKNLFDKSKYTLGAANIVILDTGIRLTATADYGRVDYNLKLKPLTTYILHVNGKTINGNANKIIAFERPDMTKIIPDVYFDGVVNSTFTAPFDGIAIIKFYVGLVGDVGAVVEYLDIQLEEGTSATTYEPYKSDTVLNQLTTPLCGLLSAQDIMNTDGTLDRTIGKVVYTGADSEGWSLYQTGTDYISFISTTADVKLSSELLCDNFNVGDYDAVRTATIEGIVSKQVTNGVCISIAKTKLATVDLAGFKTWLGANNTTVYYVKATATQETIAKPVLESFKDGSLAVNTVIPPETEVTYPINVTGAIVSNADGIKKIKDNTQSDINATNVALAEHTADDVKHITAVERTTWNGKANADINHIQPADTVLSWANRQTVNSSILNIDTAIPSDAPYSAEWQFEVLVGDANRKIVRATHYNGGEIYYRTIFNGVWNTNWCKIITDTGGTMAGILTAQANTSYTVAQVRNIIAWDGTGTKPSPVNGAILLTYTP